MNLRSCLVAAAVVFWSSQSVAEKLTLVSWNLEHLMSVSGFERWREFCQPHEFSDALALTRGQARPKGLTFCTAHMGTGWPPRATPPKPGVSACPRQTVAVQSLAMHTERQRGLREALKGLAVVTTSMLALVPG